MSDPAGILRIAVRQAVADLKQSHVATEMSARVEYVARNLKNRAGIRLLMACLLAKIDRPEVDVRKPYTEIGTDDSFSGRTYDERYISDLITEYELPCNSTTAFLTPALRNRAIPLTIDVDLVGRPPQLYKTVLNLLDDVYQNRATAENLLSEVIRWLLIERNEQQQRIASLIHGLRTLRDAMPLSSEDMVLLIEQHMNLKGTSRLPVLVVAAAYKTAATYLNERILVLNSHLAADIQTGALGDIEITIAQSNDVVTSYEMKDKSITKADIDRALQKLSHANAHVDNYIFITTETIDEAVQGYARSLYTETGGTEFVILTCIGFLRHFLHLFHRLRSSFLEEYQALMLVEPPSSVSQPIKEAFLAMRQAAESGLGGI